jgi:alpha-L-arabinofuranosidase
MLRKSIPAKSRQRVHRFLIEPLETRTLLSTVTVNATTAIGPVQTNLLGVNFATWDSLVANNGNSSNPTLNTQTQQLVAASGINTFRIPGGGTSDFFHWAISGGGAAVNGSESVAAMAELVASVNGVGMVTVNYGTGSPQEGAAMLAYLNGAANSAALNSVTLGSAPIFLATTSNTEPQNLPAGSDPGWTTYNWQTAGFWATLRSQTPLQVNDGLNFLRIGRTQPFGFHYFEIGNEIYGATAADGSFSADAHADATFPASSLPMPAGTTPAVGDPTTYIAFAKEFQTFAKQIDPTISIGLDSASISKNDSANWINKILTQSVSQGFQPGFISDHIYPQAPGDESDSTLLGYPTTAQSGVVDTINNAVNTYDLAQRSAVYRSLFTHYFPGSNVPGAANYIELLATEYNSVYTTPGKQSVSIVNGLFVADSIGSMLNTEAAATGQTTTNGTTGYDGLWVWDLHNGSFGTDNDSSSLYGWRTGTNYGDYGILGTGSGVAGELNNVQYPDYFSEQLASKIVKAGGEVVNASSDSTLLDAYAVMESNGHLALLVVNKNRPTGTPPNNLPDQTISETFNLNGFVPSGQSTIYQYGVPEDDTQANNSPTYAAALSNPTPPTISGTSFTYAIPDYTMMVFDLAPAPPAVTQAAAAAPNPITSTTTQLSVQASDPLTTTYTWSATGPAAVTYNTNGTTAAKSTTATFIQAGSYTFIVTIKDTNNLTTTSSVNVTVNQTLTAINVTPTSPLVPDGQTQSFSTAAIDQFNNSMSAAVTWSLDTGSVGSINSSTGLYTAPTSGVGSATIRATNGSVSGTAAVTIQLTTIAGTTGNDTIRLSANGSSLNVYINNPTTPAYSAPLSSLGPLTLLGNGGIDQIIIDFSGTSTPVPSSGLTVDGTGGSANLSIVGTTGDDTATVTANTITFNASSIHYTNIASIAVNSGTGNDTLTQSAQPAAPLSFSGGSTDTLNVNAGNFTFPTPSTGAGIEPTPLNLLSIAANATVSLPTASANSDRTLLVLSSLQNAGLLDLGGNDLILHGGDPTQITSQIAEGFNHGLWNGPVGITSSAAAISTTTALGIELNDDGTIDHNPLTTSFDGQPVINTDLLVKYTFAGDADLSAAVDANDYLLIDAGFSSNSTTWHSGDFNYDGVINGDDYTLIDNAFNTQESITLSAKPATLITNKSPAAAITKPTALPSAQLISDATELKKRRPSIWTTLEETNS